MSELIALVGDDNIEFQRVGSGYFKAQETPKECKITFATKPGTALQMERGELIGLMVWLKQSDVDQAVEYHKKNSKP